MSSTTVLDGAVMKITLARPEAPSAFQETMRREPREGL